MRHAPGQMNDGIVIEIPGEPVPKARPRMAGNGRIYTPKKTADWEQRAGSVAMAAMSGRARLECALDVEVVAYLPVPESWPKWKRSLVTCHGLFISHSGKPDADNLAKAALDALNGIVWRDDAQIADLVVRKRYCKPGQAPRVVVCVDTVIGAHTHIRTKSELERLREAGL